MSAGGDGDGSQWEWDVLCGRGVNNFTVWVDGDFGHCFEQLVFSCTTHLLLALVSGYYIFKQAHRRVGGPLPRAFSLHTRLAVSLLLAVLPLFLITLTYAYVKVRMSPVDVLTAVVKTCTWIVHSGFVFRHHRMYHVHVRGPLPVVLAFLLAAVSTAIQLRTVILHVVNQLPFLNVVETYTTYVTAGLYLVYVVTLIPATRPRLTHLHYSLSIEDADSVSSSPGPAEHEPLLSPETRQVQYGGISRTPSEDDPQQQQHLGTAEDYDNCLSRLTFFWVRSLMVKGAHGGLSRSRDLYDLPQKLRTKYIEEQFAAVLNPRWVEDAPHGSHSQQNSVSSESTQSPTSPNTVPNVSFSGDRANSSSSGERLQRTLLSALHKCFGLEYYLLGILKLLADLIGFAGPLLLNYLVAYMENQNEPVYHGYIYASCLFASTLIGAFLSTHFNYRITNVGLKVRAAIITTVFKKTIGVNAVTLSTYSTGQVLNFMSTDTDRIVNFCPSFHQLWSLPFQVVLSLFLLYRQVGLAFLAGLAFAVILIPINRWLAIKICQLSTEMMAQKDSRVKIMSEILTGIRVIKFYAWEDHFAAKVNAARLAELKSLKGRKYLDALCVYFWATTPVLISILTFTTYALLGHQLTAAKVFTSLALFNMLISPLNAFPWVINGMMEAWVSLKRVREFLLLPEQDLRRFYSSAAGLQRNSALRVQKGYFSWVAPGAEGDGTASGDEPSLRECGDGQEEQSHPPETPTSFPSELTNQNTASSDSKAHEESQGDDHGNDHGQDQTTIQSDDQCKKQGDGPTQSQGEGQNSDQGEGQCNNQRKDHSNSHGEGQSNSQAEGQSISQGEDQSISQGEGQNNDQSEGQSSNQGEGQTNRQDDDQSNSQHQNIRNRNSTGQYKSNDYHHSNSQGEVSVNNHVDSESQNPENRDNSITEMRTLRLENINIEVKQGSLVGVVGRVGSGKSSLLAAILAEMHKEYGQVAVSSLDAGFGYVGQEAWVQHATVRDNILFGRYYDEERYKAVLDACALVEDLKILPAGDMTEVGENGVTLSGGQKARVSLARAVYQDKDVYLLDDPLAALDAHVARHVFTHCIMGLLDGKTRVVCTHHVEYLKDADSVIVMEDGRITVGGPPALVMENLVDNLLTFTSEKVKQTEEAEVETGQEEEQQEVTGKDASGAALVEEEEQDTGVVKAHVYSTYWRAVGMCLSPTVLLSLLLMQASRNINDWWLSYWVSHSHGGSVPSTNCSSTLYAPEMLTHLPNPASKALLAAGMGTGTMAGGNTPWCNITTAEDNVRFYLTVYGALAASNSIFTLFRAFLFAYGGIRAATVIHWYLLKSVLKAPCSFFDTTPTGRVLNRFSSDLYSVDDSLPFILNILLAQAFSVLGTIVITCYGLPWFALLLVPLGILYYFIQKYYRQTSREIKRITSVTLSPIYAHFSETITGITTIRALRHADRFRLDNRRHLEENQRAQFAANAAGQWLGLRLQMFGVAMVTSVAFIAVLEHHFHTVDPGLIGLAISYALSITSLLSGVVTSFAETEKQMVSVERCGQYMTDIPSERQDSLLCMPPFWPMQGAVSFHRVCLQYREGLALSLNNVSFETQPAEKIGVVGRTGSGKSSLLVALFRMVELKDGYVTIDGLNLAHLDLRELRARMAIIPQDPFLYSGSVRENLDPRDLYTDTQLWTLLERCHLAAVVRRLGGLDAEVAERGRHLSVGQRQLLCLARAMVTRAKVLCIDEATASVDQETDSLIQETIRREFAHHTVITIAHRIHTILDNDRVLVMNRGRVAEFDPPGVLLDNPGSLFYSLVHGQSQS